jgi:hypothetical protein
MDRRGCSPAELPDGSVVGLVPMKDPQWSDTQPVTVILTASIQSEPKIPIFPIQGPAPRTDEPLTPIGNGRFGAVSLRHFGGIGLNLMLAIPAPHDQANTGSSGIPKRHRGTGLRLHLTAHVNFSWISL